MYQVESKLDGVWSAGNVTAGGDNEFDTRAEAESMIPYLRTLGPDWEIGEYRVVEFDEEERLQEAYDSAIRRMEPGL